MTARKMKVSATDLLLWLFPSAFITGTVKRLAAKVSSSMKAHGAKPVHPSIGSLRSEKMEKTKSRAATTETLASRARLFQLPFGMMIPLGVTGTAKDAKSFNKNEAFGWLKN